MSGFGYNELVRQCQVVGPATDQLGMSHLSLFGSNSTTAGGRRRRSSFPPGGTAGAAGALAEDIFKKHSSESDEGDVLGEVASSGGQISLASGARKVVAMTPRYVCQLVSVACLHTRALSLTAEMAVVSSFSVLMNVICRHVICVSYSQIEARKRLWLLALLQ